MDTQTLIFTNSVNEVISQAVGSLTFDKLYILCDDNTQKQALPLLNDFIADNNVTVITIKAGDINKNIDSLSQVWMALSKEKATRKSLLINLGGGMVTDLGGFAASTFKRGINFINVPTSLLGAVDAAVGGKTGINFNGLKNEIGVFSPAKCVIISTQFFKTLDNENLLSGYAEMLKHSLLESDESLKKLLAFNPVTRDYDHLLSLLKESVEVKERVVKEDPFEKGLRKALNLGHTVAHSFESYALSINKPILHGYAVAWGVVCELILSHQRCGFPKSALNEVADYVKSNYGVFYFTCKEYDTLYEFMKHDKKNESDSVNFTLLKSPGIISLNQTATKEEIFVMLDIYRDLFNI
ncbi:MAG: 3-dehydroquinate synthase [Bacteroidales bacterium]|nr:3-dehydroquinate synthase [Bacteroidales bacterium]